jgi:hypothetical protein
MVCIGKRENQPMRSKKRKKWKMSWNTNKTTLKFNQIIIQYEIANQILAIYLEAGQINKANKVFTRVLMTSSSR